MIRRASSDHSSLANRVRISCVESNTELESELASLVNFSTHALESYAFKRWQPLIHDAMVVAAIVEVADRVCRRRANSWHRSIRVQIPVTAVAIWRRADVQSSLVDALSLLTGDRWSIGFARRARLPEPFHDYLDLGVKARAVMAYSDGLDSRAVAGIVGEDLGLSLLRVRVGGDLQPGDRGRHSAFTSVPYSTMQLRRNVESTVRSRGFKFAMITGIAAYLVEANSIVMPESGQGVFGSAMLTVAHGYPDYRNHPLFFVKMERLLHSLFTIDARFILPQQSFTKAETLRKFVSMNATADWRHTRSCWRSSQWVSYKGKRRQCGMCAACLLRRMSVHAAGLTEDADAYICADLSKTSLQRASLPGFRTLSAADREYAIAGVLHLDHLADLARAENRQVLSNHASRIARETGGNSGELSEMLCGLVERHAAEWQSFVGSCGRHSFLRAWMRGER